MTAYSVRPVEPAEFPAVAGLRWRWLAETGGEAVGTREEFVGHFTAWARENSASHHCLVAVRDDVVVGMAWLALVRRVPTPQSPVRCSGDVQCVYVVPDLRGEGLGGRLLEGVLALARELELERITVHSSFRAVSVYCRHGFGASPRLLQAHP